MSMAALAQQLQAQGRGGDTILAHINPEEAAMLKAAGGSGTINPATGLVEYGFFDDLWNGFTDIVRQAAPILLPAVAIFMPTLIPSIGTFLGATTATGAAVLGSAALSAGVTLASGGSLKDVLTSAALAGATTYITPVLGKTIGDAVGLTSATSQALIGAAASSGGLAALRGGSAREIIAAAATGAATSYVTGIARDAFANINAAKSTGNLSTVTNKGATAASVAAADAAQLKSMGLTQSQTKAALVSTGVNDIAADYCVKATWQGSPPSEVAVVVAAQAPNGAYTNGTDGTGNSISLGNNLPLVQRLEDAVIIGNDASRLNAQGLNAAQIRENLMASGVSESVATLAAQRADAGYTPDRITSDVQTNYGKTDMYTNTSAVVGRDLGEVMTAEQTDAWRAVPYKASVDAGKITAHEANILSQNAYGPADVARLTALGYSGSDLADMASTGVAPTTLTTLAATRFPESSINDMLAGGASANDISFASRIVDTGKLTVNTAQTLLSRDFDGNLINTMVTKGVADRLAASNLTPATVTKLSSNGYDIGRAVDLAAAGNNINDLAAQNKFTDLQKLYAPAPVARPTANTTPITTATTTAPAAPVITATQQAVNAFVPAEDLPVLRAAGYNNDQILSLKSSGYTAADLVDMASTGVSGGTLTGLTSANTPFSTDQIVDMLSSGASATDISGVGSLAKTGKISTATAENFINRDYDQTTVNRLMGNSATKPYIDQIAASGLDRGAVNTALNYGYTKWDQLNQAIAAGADIATVNRQLASGNLTAVNQTVSTALAPKPAPTTPTANTTPTTTTTTTAPAPAPPATTIPVVDSTGRTGEYDLTTGVTTYPDTGETVAQPGNLPVTSGTQTAAGPAATVSGLPYYAERPPPEGTRLPTGYVVASTNDYTNARWNDEFDTLVDLGTGARFDADSNTWVKPAPTPTPVPPATRPAEPVEPPTIPMPVYVGPLPITTPTTPLQPVAPAPPLPDRTVTPVVAPPPAPPAPPPAPPAPPPPAPPPPAPPVVLPTPVVPAPVTPTTPAPVVTPPPTPAPVAPAPVTPAPVVTTPTTPAPVVTTPTTPAPVVTTPAPPPLVPLTPAPPLPDRTVTPVDVTPPPPLVPLTPAPPLPDRTVTPVVAPPPPPVTVEPPPPPVVLPTPVVPTPPTSSTRVWDPVTASFVSLPNLPLPGLNPGWIQGLPHYQATSPVQSQYYWGQHPYQPGPVFNPTLYNQTPAAPAQPWGLQQLYTPTNIQQYLASQVPGPVAPAPGAK